MEQINKLIITDESLLSSKENTFKKSFTFNSTDNGLNDKIAVISDFDFTLNNKFDYETGVRYESSYGCFDKGVFGCDQEEFTKLRLETRAKYIIYEEDNSYPLELRKQKLYEWNELALKNMTHENFTRDHVKLMIENNRDKIHFKKNVKTFYEKLIKLNIPIILVSGGVKEVIEEMLKLLDIEGLDEYFKRKRIFIIANEFIFDEKTKKCVGVNKNIVYGYNKPEYVKNLVDTNFPNIENILVLGDLVTDYESISLLKLNKDKNVIGIGFLYFTPAEVKKGIDVSNNETIKSYQTVFDIILLLDEGYDYPLKLLDIFSS